jgi:excinuclease ABC subunit C
MESRLIKDTKPRFNARLADDKTFPYLAITMREEFPGVYITRTPTEERFKGARIFGPFTSVYALRESMQLLQRVFKYRTCTLDIKSDDPKNRFFRPCILHPIGQCSAPCGNRITPDEYRQDIQRFTRFLESKRSTMLRELTEEMERAAKAREFERAANLRATREALATDEERVAAGGDDFRD